jgi:acetolactate synthase-1/2/3 large subunit
MLKSDYYIYRTISHSDRPAVATEKSPKTVQRLSRKTSPVEMDDSFVGMSGGEIFHEMMLRHDVKHVFGYPGGAILPVFDAIYESEYFKFILPRHEQGAGHMAEGYAKATYVD